MHDQEDLYFVTATISVWEKIFLEENYAKIIIDSLLWLRRNHNIMLFAFVLMPSHLHMIIKPIHLTIAQVLQQFGSFTAHQIIQLLKQEKRNEILDKFHIHRRDNQRNYSVWQDIQAKNIFSDKFLNQKLEYIHNNPINKEWNLINDRADYKYSSAGFYDKEIRPIIPIDDLREWLVS